MKADQAFADRLAYGLLLLGVCGSGAGLLAGFGLARGINRRLVQLSVPIRNAAGRLDEVVGPITFDANADLEQIESVLHQMSERIGAIIDRLRESERQVLQAEQLASVGQMAAGMAHELRNPLTSMKILVQAAMATEAPPVWPAATSSCSRTRSAGWNGWCSHSSNSPGRRRSRSEPWKSARWWSRPSPCVARRAALTGTRIDLASPPEPILAALDPGQFRQVLLNLLVNALEAGDRWGRHRSSPGRRPGRLADAPGRRSRPRSAGRAGTTHLRPICDDEGNWIGPGTLHMQTHRRGSQRRHQRRQPAGRRRRVYNEITSRCTDNCRFRRLRPRRRVKPR